MNTLFDVKKQLRSIVGDDEASWTGDDYLVPKINFAYQTQTDYINSASGSNLEQIVEIPNALDAEGNSITQGLTSLSGFQQPGGLLEGLYEPLFLWWKPAGTPDRNYVEVYEKKTLPFTQPQIFSPCMRMYFTWRSNQLFLTPVNGQIDLLVDGRFTPPPLVKDTDYLVVDPFMSNTVIPATLVQIGIESGNSGYQSGGATQAELAADLIVARIIRGKQGYTARAGSNGRKGHRGWFWS